jgi:hypothetical protein
MRDNYNNIFELTHLSIIKLKLMSKTTQNVMIQIDYFSIIVFSYFGSGLKYFHKFMYNTTVVTYYNS